jgi:hypothetical protein
MRIRELPKAEGIKIIVGFLMFVFLCIFWYLQNLKLFCQSRNNILWNRLL